MPKALIFSLPKMGSIALSGVKNCLLSGHCSFFSLIMAQRALTIWGRLICSPFLVPRSVASSGDRVSGLVNPDPRVK